MYSQETASETSKKPLSPPLHRPCSPQPLLCACPGSPFRQAVQPEETPKAAPFARACIYIMYRTQHSGRKTEDCHLEIRSAEAGEKQAEGVPNVTNCKNIAFAMKFLSKKFGANFQKA